MGLLDFIQTIYSIETNEVINEKEIDSSCKELLEKREVFGTTDFIPMVSK